MSDSLDFITGVRDSDARRLAPGIGAIALKHGAAPEIVAFGRRSAFAQEAVTASDLWHIGSCTKAMTATILARLVDRGLTRFDMTLADALPDLKTTMHPGFRDTVLTDVLTHNAGLRRDPERSTFSALRRSSASARAQRQFLAAEALRIAPRPGVGYSNVGYILIGAVIERLLDLPWERVLADELMAPLGITRFGFGPPGEVGGLDQPRGHVLIGDEWRVRTVTSTGDNPTAYGPAGRVHLGLESWAWFLNVHLGVARLLEPASLRVLHHPASNGFAMGWRVNRDAATGETRLSHTGSNTAWFAQAVLAPLRGSGVAVVCNGYSQAVVEAVDRLTQGLMAYHHPDTAP